MLEYEREGHTVIFRKEDPFAILILNDLMKRVHRLESGKDIVFVDTTNSYDYNYAITFFLTTCSAGAVPIATIIMKSQSEDEFSAGQF